MTREELKTATTEKLISALEYCGRDSYYATYYDEVVDEITKRLKQNEELQEELKLEKIENKDLIERVNELEKQIEKMKNCSNCDNWNWKHSKCEKKLKGDCFKASKWVMRNF